MVYQASQVSSGKVTTVIPAISGSCYYCGDAAIAAITMEFPRAGKIRHMERLACERHLKRQHLGEEDIKLLAAFRRAVEGSIANSIRQLSTKDRRANQATSTQANRLKRFGGVTQTPQGYSRNNRVCLSFRQEGRGRPLTDAKCLVCQVPHHLHPHG